MFYVEKSSRERVWVCDSKEKTALTHTHTPGTKMVNVIFQGTNLKNMIRDHALFELDRNK